jgi:DNA-binding CsgD family transcriptional regulator
MVFLAPKLHSHIETTARVNYSAKQLKASHFQQSKQPSLLQAIIEGFVDSVLILTEQGELVHANGCARRIFHQLRAGASQPNPVAEEIWRVYKCLIESRELFREQKIIIESEINTDDSGAFRIRARWLEFDESDEHHSVASKELTGRNPANRLQHSPYLLVTIEDRHQSAQNSAFADAQKYGLTPRETEVWLLRRRNHSYKEIAAKLYITLDTVKKHMKNIYAKQRECMGAEELG